MSARITVSNDELVTVREAMRGLNRMVAALEAGETEKFVLTKHGLMVAVVLPISAVEGPRTPGEPALPTLEDEAFAELERRNGLATLGATHPLPAQDLGTL